MRRAFTIGVLAAAVSGIAIPSAGATGPHVGCPPPVSGYIVWDVSQEPYQADNQVDAGGNANGFVCAKPMNKTFVLDGQTYRLHNFIDDVVVS